MERVIIFIDGSNFYHGLKEEFGTAKIDFAKFGDILSRGRKLEKIYYYNAPLVQTKKNKERYKAQQRFFNNLKFVPNLIVKLGRLEKRVIEIEHKGIARILGKKHITFQVEKGVDVNIAVDMLTLAYNNAYDVAILVSGDGDFAVAVEAIKKLGKPVECAYFRNRKCFHIQRAASRFISLDKNYLAGCLLPKRK